MKYMIVGLNDPQYCHIIKEFFLIFFLLRTVDISLQSSE